MTTTFRQNERVETETRWTPRFKRFAAITVGTSLLLSAVAIMCLKSDVDIVTKQQIPYIQDQLNQYQVHHQR